MTVTLVGIDHAAATDGSPTCTVASVQEGDLVVFVAGHRTSSQTGSVTTTGTWSELVEIESEIANTSARRATTVWWGLAPSSPGSTWTFDWGVSTNSTLTVIVLRDDSGGTWEVDGSGSDDNGTTAGQSLSAPTGVTNANAHGVAILGVVTRYGELDDDFAWDAGYAGGGEFQNAGSNGISGGAAYEILSTSASQTSAVDWTSSSQDALGTAVLAVLSVSTGFTAGTGTATGDAHDASTEIEPTAGTGTATGTGHNASAGLGPTASTATATATGHDASVAVSAIAGTATATGTAHDATVDTGGAQAGTATATATGHDATVSIGPTAGTATATGTAHDATVATGGFVAGTGTATGTGHDAAVIVGPAPGGATATATGHDPTAALGAPTGTATATGTAHDATVLVGAHAGTATATGTGHDVTGPTDTTTTAPSITIRGEIAHTPTLDGTVADAPTLRGDT